MVVMRVGMGLSRRVLLCLGCRCEVWVLVRSCFTDVGCWICVW